MLEISLTSSLKHLKLEKNFNETKLKIIMENENYMPTNRLEAFYNAIIAIIVTVLVLELPQPETASIAAIWL